MIESVVGTQRGVDPPNGSIVYVCEIPKGRANVQSLDHSRPCLAPCAFKLQGRRRYVGFEAIARRPARVTGKAVVIAKVEPVFDAAVDD